MDDGDLGTGAENAGAHKMTRRRIYLQRLIGDDLWGNNSGRRNRASYRALVRFVLYLGVATLVITTRSNVPDRHEINVGLHDYLSRTGVTVGSSVMYLDDIRSRDDVLLWVDRALFGSILGQANQSEFRGNLTLMSFNRVTPSVGVCMEAASVLLTLRRASITTNVEPYVTSRFSSLYPRMWLVDSIPAGTASRHAGEDTDTIISENGNYTWKHTGGGKGFRGQGGYLATATLLEDGRSFIHLMDYGADATVNDDESEGACFGMPSTSSMTPEEFWEQGFFDSSFSSLAVEFLAYNANLQTMSRVQVTFDANFAGVIMAKDIRVDTLLLDVYSSTMRYFEVVYLIATCLYCVAFIYHGSKRRLEYFRDAWTWINGASISLSILSLVLWFSYEPMLEQYLVDGRFRDMAAFEELVVWNSNYSRASAAATLMIYLRVVQYLANIASRVQLLSETLRVGASNMAIYVSYIGVILGGSAAFAQTYFSSFSLEFVSLQTSFLNCYNLFFGKTDSLRTVDGTAAQMKNLFYIPFMVFFYFVSVQMFNAIINYSYNRVSEEMEPRLEQEKIDKKRRAALDTTNTFWWRMGTLAINRLRQEFPALLGPPSDPADRGTADELDQSDVIDALDEDSKAKVEHYLQRELHKGIPDGSFNIVLFCIFAVCYIWFLSANLSVDDNFQINRVVERSIASVPTHTGGRLLSFKEIATLPAVVDWMAKSFPLVVFNTTPPELKASAVAWGFYADTAVCLRSWNCLVDMRQASDSASKLVRITQRRTRQEKNEGRFHPDTPDRARFVGEVVNGTSLDASTVLMPKRWLAAIDPTEAPDPAAENSSLLTLPPGLSDFCWETMEGDEASFSSNGGFVCLLDADYSTFVSQIDQLGDNGFFTTDSSSWVVDFAMQNSNRQILSYVQILVEVQRSGLVVKDYRVDSIKLFGLDKWYENFGSIALRLLPGVMYMCLTFRFIYNLRKDFVKVRYASRGRNKGTSCITAVIDFFRYDVFNCLELVSISISLVSAFLYVWWMVRDAELEQVKQSSFTALLRYCQSLVWTARLYNRLSAINILIIGVRPLKFVRENARFSKLMATLWDSSQDLRWFVVMLFVTMSGFVMLAHISFGAHVSDCSSLWSTLVYCFRFLLGDFDYAALLAVDPMAAFMFPYLIIMYCVFTNIFFAIIDRHFIAIDPPPFQWKKQLRPLLHRCCRCVDWEEDHQMEVDPNADKQPGPPSRRDRVKKTQKRILEIQRKASQLANHSDERKAFNFEEVCEFDPRLEDVWHWSTEEARLLVADIERLLNQKRNASNDENFVRNEVMENFFKPKLETSKGDMMKAGRQMRYACKVDELVIQHDQETLAKYAFLLERQIFTHSRSKASLEQEVDRLKGENNKMNMDSWGKPQAPTAQDSSQARSSSERDTAPKPLGPNTSRQDAGKASGVDTAKGLSTSATHDDEREGEEETANNDPTAPMEFVRAGHEMKDALSALPKFTGREKGKKSH
mmetsp:Transcript_18087/g.51494  ORF Transcript_18087/g.51494 Transcript_18087/m.51494 type:complete len:1485 (-) Transcript_18087:87-4541(-)